MVPIPVERGTIQHGRIVEFNPSERILKLDDFTIWVSREPVRRPGNL